MKINRIIALALTCLMLLTVGCNKVHPDREPDKGEGPTDQGGVNAGSSSIKLLDGEVVFRGRVTEISQNEIMIEIEDSDVAFGPHRVLVQASTPYYDKDGKEITKEDIKKDDVIDVVFGGQVMMSYPPQIAAYRVYLAE